MLKYFKNTFYLFYTGVQCIFGLCAYNVLVYSTLYTIAAVTAAAAAVDSVTKRHVIDVR